MPRPSTWIALAVLLAPVPPAARADDPPPGPPAPRPEAPAGPSDAEREKVKRMVDELRAEASRIRGLAWKFPVPADLITRKQMREAFVAEIDAEYPPAKRERDTAILRRVGLLGPDQDPVALQLDFFEAGVAGFYDPKKKILRIVEGLVGEAQRPTILHELTHALEDQYVDLEARTKPFEDDPDRLFAEKILGEGSAETARWLYQAAHPELAALFREGQADAEMAAAQMRAFTRIPAFLFYPTLLHYRNGPAFVGAAVRGGSYPERMAALYKDPPVSQEQVLHPSRWFDGTRDYPQAVVWGGDLAATAGEGWSVYHQQATGELDLAVMLDFHLSATRGKYVVLAALPIAAARKAATGWDAGWTAVLRKADLPLGLVSAYAFDTPRDAWEAAEALGQALEKAAGTAWKATGWVKEGPGDVPEKAVLEYANGAGASRLALRGTRLLQVDGVPAEVLGRLWPVVEATAFVRDARDTWTPEVEDRRFAAATFRDAARGVSFTPPEGWKAEATSVGAPGALALVRDAAGDVRVLLSVQDRPMTTEGAVIGLLSGLQAQGLQPEIQEGEGIAEEPGVRLVVGVGKDGRHQEIVLGFAWQRTLVARLSASDAAALDRARPAVAALLASVRTRDL